MNEIRALLRLARTRLEMSIFVGVAHGVTIVLAAVALALALADRLPGEAFVAWAWIVPALLVVGGIVSFALWHRRRLSEIQVAVAVDDRLDLREKLSTALHCHGRDDPFAQAAVQDAVHSARDPRSRETVRRRFAVAAPTRWWISPLILVVTFGVLLAPQADLFAQADAEEEKRFDEAQVKAKESLEVVIKAVEDKPLLKQELDGLVDDMATQQDRPAALAKPEQVKRDALKKVTELNKKLDDILNGEKGKTAKAIEDMMSKLEAMESGPAKELSDALTEGDFSKAKKALEQMLEDLQNGAMNEAQKQQLAEQLQQLGEQMAKLAEQQQALEQALKQAGLNPQLANNPQALQQALQQAQNLNPQQKQQLQQMIQAQQAAQQMAKGLAGACQNMGQMMQQGQMGQGQGQGQMMQQLNQLEQMQQLLQQAQAAANQCQGQGQGLGQGMSMAQAMQMWMQGGGMGYRGQGSGGKAPNSPTPFGKKLQKADAPVVEGEIIASMLIDGTPIRGESKAKLRKVIESGATGYDEAITEDPLPRRYHEAQKHYFGELQRQVEAKLAEVEASERSGASSEGSAEEPAESSDSGE
jgi:hypothetical protein